MSAKSNADREPSSKTPSTPAGPGKWLLKLVFWLGGLAVAAVLSIVFVAGVAMVVAYPNLPDISDLADYRPKLPLRVYTADGVLMGEFGEERRNLTPINEIPKVMKDAVLSIEDARFYQHGGVDYLGIARSTWSSPILRTRKASRPICWPSRNTTGSCPTATTACAVPACRQTPSRRS